VSAPSSSGIKKSPASLKADSRRSTKRRDRTTAAVSSSRANGTLDPTALMCVPGAIHPPSTTGSFEEVTVQTPMAELEALAARPSAAWAFSIEAIGAGTAVLDEEPEQAVWLWGAAEALRELTLS